MTYALIVLCPTLCETRFDSLVQARSHCTVRLDDRLAQGGEMVYCFVTKMAKSVSGLLIEPTGSRGQYIRCGRFHVRGICPRKGSLEDFKALCKLPANSIEAKPGLYEERTAAGKDGFPR